MPSKSKDETHKCLIIAAGRGSRLSSKIDSKPLTHLLGISLIERVILTAQKSGLSDFYVVTGYNGVKVREYLDRFSKARKISITHIVNDEWQKGNGVSVLKARGLIRENFILLSKCLSKMIAGSPRAKGLFLRDCCLPAFTVHAEHLQSSYK